MSNTPLALECKKHIDEFMESNKSSVEDIHRLRTKIRELLSLLEHTQPFYKELKSVIKLSNKIRDIDVFYEHFINSLPKKHLKELYIKDIQKTTDKKRQKALYRLQNYIKSLEFPSELTFGYIDTKEYFATRPSSPNQEELHKYRIYIKKMLYNEKNSPKADKKKIKKLTKIKDMLGTINDNFNGFELLCKFSKKSKVLYKVEKFVKKQNMDIFRKFEKLTF